MNDTILDVRGKNKMAGITQNGEKSLIFIVVPKHRKQLKLVLLVEGKETVVVKTMIIVIRAITVVMTKIILVATITTAI